MLNEDCYTALIQHSSSDVGSKLNTLCKTSQKAAKEYMRTNQWSLTGPIFERTEDMSIPIMLSQYTPPPVSEGLFYENLPLTAYHVKKLNELFDILGDDSEPMYEKSAFLSGKYEIELPDEGFIKDVSKILYKELTKIGFKVLLNDPWDFDGGYIEDKGYDIILMNINNNIKDSNSYNIIFTDNVTDFDPLYVQLLNCPVWVHVKNDSKEYDVPDIYYHSRICDRKIFETKARYLPLPCELAIFTRSSPTRIDKGFSFEGLTWSEITYVYFYNRNSSKEFREMLEESTEINGRDPPIKFQRLDSLIRFDIYLATRTDIEPDERDFWILIDPKAKPTDKPLILFTDPRDMIKLPQLLSTFHNSSRETQVRLIEILIKENMLRTNIPLHLLSLSDDEVISKVKSPLLRLVKEGHQLPRLLILYDSLPITEESIEYVNSLNISIKYLLYASNISSELVKEIK